MSLDTEIKRLTDLRDSLPQPEEIKCIIQESIKKNPQKYSDLIMQQGEDNAVNLLYIKYCSRFASKREEISLATMNLLAMKERYSPLSN